MHPKAMPGHVGTNNMTGKPALGIWRAHANVWRYIIDNNIQSALIIEDDVDWDVNIKEIMGTLNWNLRYNNTIRWGKDNVQKGWKEDCPYGRLSLHILPKNWFESGTDFAIRLRLGRTLRRPLRRQT